MQKTIKEILKNPGKPFPVTFRILHKQGHYIWLNGMLTNMLNDESIKAIVGNFKDITESKLAKDQLEASEIRFRSIIEQFPYPVVTYSPDGTYINANESWEIMWQEKRENIKGYNIRKDKQIISSGLSQYVEKAFAGEVAFSNPYLYDPALIGQAGRKRWIQMTLYPLKNKEGEILEVILVLQDVSENIEAAEEIRLLNESLEKKVIERTKQLETANKELESFSYSVSHDLRAPLRIIDGYAEIMSTDFHNKLDAEGNRILGIISANARKMGQLIDDLLNLSRFGRKDLVLLNVDMNNLVKSAIEELYHGKEKLSEIKIVALLSAPCDNNLMKQVWINLISNAVKYSGTREKPIIEISSNREDNNIIYSIKDNGVGFDMNYAGKLFGVFQRLHKVSEFDGTGVGLALVKSIIEKHGGKVWAHSEKDKGATFSFSLPIGKLSPKPKDF